MVRLAERLSALRPEEASREDQSGVVALLDQLVRLVSQAQRLVEQRAAQAEDEPSLAVDHSFVIRRCVLAIEWACTYDLAALERTPHRDFEPLIGPFTELARTLSGRAATELVFEATEAFMYRVHADAFEDLRKQLRFLTAAPFSDPEPAILERLPPLALIAYPVRADEDTLGHAVVAHEVAHLALSRPSGAGEASLHEQALGRVTSDASQTADQPDVELIDGRSPTTTPSQAARPDADGVPSPAERPPTQHLTTRAGAQGSGTDRHSERLKSWMDELACDLLAVRMMGPAYFFALVEFAQVSGQTDHVPDTPGYDTHPSVVWRLQRVRTQAEHYLDRDRDSEAMHNVVRVFDEFSLYVDFQERFALSVTEHERADRERVLRGVEFIDEHANELLGNARYTKRRFVRDLDLVWRKLSTGIAPVERIRGRPMSEGELELPLEGVEDLPPMSEGEPPEPPEPMAGNWSRPLDWRSILNGCYAFHLSAASARLEGEEGVTPARRQADSQMCRGAIELAEYLRRMLTLHEQFRHIDILGEQ